MSNEFVVLNAAAEQSVALIPSVLPDSADVPVPVLQPQMAFSAEDVVPDAEDTDDVPEDDEDDIVFRFAQQADDGESDEVPQVEPSEEDWLWIKEMKAEVNAEHAENFAAFKDAYGYADQKDAQVPYLRFRAGFDDACAWSETPLQFTEITSRDGKVLSKHFEYENGQVVKKGSPAFGSGHFKTKKVNSLLEFCDTLNSAGVDQAFMYSVSTGPEEGVITTRKLLPQCDPSNTSARIKECFSHANAPGIVALDYDVPKDGVTPLMNLKQLVQVLKMAIPALEFTALVGASSGSAHIYDEATGREIRGQGGWRIYAGVRNAADIPRLIEVLFQRLWQFGFGRIELSVSGAKLKRTLVDPALSISVQPDFVGGASCGSGLIQKLPAPEFIQDGPLLDSEALVPSLTRKELQIVADLIKNAENEIDAEAKARRESWLAERRFELANALIARAERSPNDLATLTKFELTAKEVLVTALDSRVLTGDFMLLSADGREVSVSEILRQKDAFDGMIFMDPIERDYDGGRPVAKLFLSGRKPTLHSMAHGGCTYHLDKTQTSIEVIAGDQAECLEKVLEELREDPCVFDYGTELVLLGSNGPMQNCTARTIGHHLGLNYRFFTTKQNPEGDWYPLNVNPPKEVCATLVELGRSRELKPLKGVLNAPTMLANGRILKDAGYDQASGYYLKSAGQDFIDIPEAPTHLQIIQAFALLMQPLGQFPWCSPLDYSVACSSLLTSIARPGLNMAPAHCFEAPTQSSGKTLAARTAAALCMGNEPPVIAYPILKGDEEMNKTLLSKAMEGAGSVIIDNIVGFFDSASLAATMTSGVIEGRVLGASKMSGALPFRPAILMSGNNMMLGGDMVQRTLIARIDSKDESPHLRSFSFDPVEMVLQDRQSFVAAGLTLLRAFVNAGMPRLGKGMSRFREWDHLVRQGMIWLAAEHGLPLVDPLQAIENAKASNPEHESLVQFLTGWRYVFGQDPFTTHEVMRWAEENRFNPGRLCEEARGLYDAIMSTGKGKWPTNSQLSTFLKIRLERLGNGMRLVRAGEVHRGLVLWKLEVRPQKPAPTLNS